MNSRNGSLNGTISAGKVGFFDSVTIWSVSVLALLIAVTVFGNILVCTAFCLCRELRNITNQFVVSLAISDLLVGFGSMPLWLVYQLGGWPVYSPIYTWWLCLDIVTGTASIMNLVIISVDRYYAITSPYQYQFKLTRTRAKMAVVFVWGYSFIVAAIRAPPFYSQSWSAYYPYVVATASFFVPLPVMIFCYVQIFRVAHEQAGKIRRQGSGGYHTCQDFSEAFADFEARNSVFVDSPVFYDGKARHSYATQRSSTSAGRSSSSAIHSYFKKNRPTLTSQNSFKMFRKAFVADLKAAKTLAIVMGSFIICWSPFIVMNIIYVTCQSCIVQPAMPTTAKWLHYSNSAMNPIIYTVMNRAFRNAFRKIMCRQLLNSNILDERSRVLSAIAFPRKRKNPEIVREKNGRKYKMETKVTEILTCEEFLSVV